MKTSGCIPAKNRIKVFLGSYPLRLLLKDGNSALVGRGSTSLIQNFTLVPGRHYEQPILVIGNFCEAAACKIIIGGEHRNEQLFNSSLASFPTVRATLREMGELTWQGQAPVPTQIGHGAILSSGCTLIQGAQIGIGAVIGAEAVVTKTEVPAFAIAVGNPARVAKQRLTAERQEMAEELSWWNWDITCLLQHARWLMNAEERMPDLLRVKKLADDRYRLVVDMAEIDETGTSYLTKVTGYEDEGRFIAIQEAPKAISDYFDQLYQPEDKILSWVPDIFKET